jgi:hypothetical protein
VGRNPARSRARPGQPLPFLPLPPVPHGPRNCLAHYPFPSTWPASQLLRPEFLLHSHGPARHFLGAWSGPSWPSSSSLNRSRLPPRHRAEATLLGRNPSPLRILTEHVEPRRACSWRWSPRLPQVDGMKSPINGVDNDQNFTHHVLEP